MGGMQTENTNQTEPVTYEIVLAYTDITPAWMRADSVKTIECMSQGPHGDRMRVVTTDATALESAMDLDDDARTYEVVDDAASDGRKTPAGWRP